MEETFLQLWDELDDILCVCRHLTTCAATETLAAAVPFMGALLGGSATLLLAHRALALLPG
jgi:hypothetical protein